MWIRFVENEEMVSTQVHDLSGFGPIRSTNPDEILGPNECFLVYLSGAKIPGYFALRSIEEMPYLEEELKVEDAVPVWFAVTLQDGSPVFFV